MSGLDALSASALAGTALGVPETGPSGRIDAFEGVAAGLRSPLPRDHSKRDPDLVDAPMQQHGLPSSVIHELRTPLTSIHGFAQVLQRNLANPSRASNALDVISRESVRLTEMLALLSELSELESEIEEPPAFAVEVRQLVEGLIQDVERRDGSQHPFTLEGAGRARCNPNDLSRALLHVLTNAVRYSDPGQPITVTISTAVDEIEIAVSDRGIGVIPSECGRIFQPYVRGSNAREYGVRGLGLGLYLARESLRQMDGWIEVEPNAPDGAIFRLAAPRA